MGIRKSNKIMKFSIIVGLYNHKRYLLKLIESLENQTFKDFEWIVCDDGSKDGTKEFFKNKVFKFPFQYLSLKKNTGNLSRNINQGIRKAKGDYCIFIMGDSFPELNYLEILNERVNPDSIICGIRVNIEGNKIVEFDWRRRKGVIPDIPVLLPDKPWEFTTGNGLTIPTDALRKYGGWNEKFKVAKGGEAGEDQELIARLYYKGFLVWSVPQLILYHNYHKGIISPKRKLLNKLVQKYAK